ncbi:MAG: hypothetical protein WD079_03265 [Phycisphaeraceae bacterium]
MQTPGAPLLSIAWQGADVRVFWPLPGTGFVLDQSLTVTGAWSQVSFPYTTNATDISHRARTGEKQVLPAAEAAGDGLQSRRGGLRTATPCPLLARMTSSQIEPVSWTGT